MTSFKAVVVRKDAEQRFSRAIEERSTEQLPPGDLLVRVHYSSLNYKDALSATGHPGVTRTFPHVPGIDAAGEVCSCSSGAFAPGDRVIITGYDLGMETDGGWSEYLQIPSGWAVPCPAALSLKESMIYGTAGFTAALSLARLEQAGVTPDDGPVLVTGATGGVGSLAVALLSTAGYRVTAATGKAGSAPYLRQCGAAEIISREELLAGSERPLMKERWAGVVDVAGGAILAAALKSTRYGGTVTCCGLVNDPALAVNVYPFILRGVCLIGIDSVNVPAAERPHIWQRLAGEWRPPRLTELATEIPLAGLEEHIAALLAGSSQGRIIVNPSR